MQGCVTNFFSDPALGKKKELNEQSGLSEPDMEPDMEPETEPEIDEKEEEEKAEGEEQGTEQEETTLEPVEKYVCLSYNYLCLAALRKN
jgi:hypothetical protein